MTTPNMPRANVICPAPERCTWEYVGGIWIVTDSTCLGKCDCTNPNAPAGHVEKIPLTDPRIAKMHFSAKVRAWGHTPGVKHADFLLAAEDVKSDPQVKDPVITRQGIPTMGVPYYKPCME